MRLFEHIYRRSVLTFYCSCAEDIEPVFVLFYATRSLDDEFRAAELVQTRGRISEERQLVT